MADYSNLKIKNLGLTPILDFTVQYEDFNHCTASAESQSTRVQNFSKIYQSTAEL